MHKKAFIIFTIIVISIITIFLLSYSKIYSYISNIITFILGIISLFVYRYFNRAIIQAELDSIDKIITDIKISEYKDLNILNEEICKNQTNLKTTVNFSELQTALNTLIEELEGLPNTISLYTEELETIDSLNTLNTLIGDNIKFSQLNDSEKKQHKKRLKDIIYKLQNRKNFLSKHVPICQNKIEEFWNTLACFRATLTLTNCGYTNIAIRKNALLRVYSNSNFYMDIKMKMCDFEKCSLKSQNTAVIIFESTEIQSFLEEDRTFTNKFWNQNISAKIFFEDINNIFYSSNEIPFADELHQKASYDKLSSNATTIMEKNT